MGEAGDTQLRVHFVTLGCPKNEVDSDRMMTAVAASGWSLVTEPEDADVVVVNTCGFIRAAVEEGIDAVLELTEWRDAAPERRLVVAGCMVSRYGDELSASLTEADAFLPVSAEEHLAELLSDLTATKAVTAALAPAGRMPATGPSAYLQIADGCFRTCAYCTIPSIRGPYRSRELADLLDEARFLAATGAREIVLVGQDTSAWGRDLAGEETLADVIRAIAAVPNVAWLRVMYVQPDGVTDELLQAMADTPNVCRYLDIPLQHASERVLRAMHRGGSGAAFLEMIARIRAIMPDVVLRTSLIAGYPGEKRADVDELIAFVRDARFDYAGVFTYSPEEGTAAGSLADLPSLRTRQARSQRVRDAADAVGFDRAAARIGATLHVLSEGLDEDGIPVGRWQGQAPEVDGIVLLDREVPAGTMVRARVIDALGYDLEAEVL
ncbi:MAG: 30S ribosomal protein S12 methylthiotransferase RimO [Coriobacteriia bacterium]